jgi:hypothetical protein
MSKIFVRNTRAASVGLVRENPKFASVPYEHIFPAGVSTIDAEELASYREHTANENLFRAKVLIVADALPAETISADEVAAEIRACDDSAQLRYWLTKTQRGATHRGALIQRYSELNPSEDSTPKVRVDAEGGWL